MIQDARGWCTGMTQKDGMGREEEGVFRMGNTRKSMADSCQCMTKTTTIKKKKNTFESVLMRRMKLEPIIQSEVSQKEKHQYSILTHIYGI